MRNKVETVVDQLVDSYNGPGKAHKAAFLVTLRDRPDQLSRTLDTIVLHNELNGSDGDCYKARVLLRERLLERLQE